MNRVSVLLLLPVLAFFLYVAAEPLEVINQTGRVNLWGAVYYVSKSGAMLHDTVKKIANNRSFLVPPLKEDAARYLVISGKKKLLEDVIVSPFSVVGIRLISLSQEESQKSIRLDSSDLPEVMH